MNEDLTYLEKENLKNNAANDCFLISKKIFSRVLIYTICSIIYIVVTIISKEKGFLSIQTQFQTSVISAIMYFCFGFSFIAVVVYIISLLSKKFNEKLDSIKYSVKKTVFNIIDWFSVLPMCATCATILFAFVFTFARVNGTSMEKNIYENDVVLTSFLETPERFDVVVCYITEEDNFVSSYGNEKYYIKRVIGVPGDRLTWIDGVLTINGEVVEETFFDDETISSYKSKFASNNDFEGEFIYKKDGRSLTSYVIPEGYYFVMGDNRRVSNDSRGIGLIPAKNMVGVVKLIFTTDSGIKVV